MIKLTDCPRDAMQGIKPFIKTEKKAKYINQLLKVGFDTLDFGSFVSPRAIPQMADTSLVLSKLELDEDSPQLSVVVANKRGAVDACFFDQIQILGYPFSISETFQQRNTNASIEESLGRVEDIKNLCDKYGKTMLIYISMGFGNPYGDPWNEETVSQWVERLMEMGINKFSLADTVGVANPESISYIYNALVPKYPEVEFAAHFHTTPDTWEEKIKAAYEAGCTRFEGALKGYGGCPMAKDDLVGNMASENLIGFFKEDELAKSINKEALNEALLITNEIFP